MYHADGTLRGELAYWVGARLGRTHCSLCDITHGLFLEKDDWRSCRRALAVPFDTYHRNDQPSAVRELTNGATPVVVAETDAGMVLLLQRHEIDSCNGSGDRLVEVIEAAVTNAALSWA